MITFLKRWLEAYKNKPKGANRWNYRNGEYWEVIYFQDFYGRWHVECSVWANIKNIGYSFNTIDGKPRWFWLPI